MGGTEKLDARTEAVGYRRFDTTTEMRLLNQMYGLLRLYKNFCLPTIKLVSKVRDGGRIKRVYDKPRTRTSGCWSQARSIAKAGNSCGASMTGSTQLN
jgi:hypothetical protein